MRAGGSVGGELGGIGGASYDRVVLMWSIVFPVRLTVFVKLLVLVPEVSVVVWLVVLVFSMVFVIW